MTTYSIPPAADLTGKVIKKSEYAVAGGAFSDVWMGEYEGRVVAIKCPRLVNVTVEKLNQRLYREHQSWARTQHENVLSLLGFCTDLGPVVCFISPWMEHGTATTFLEEHPGSDRIKLLQGLANGLLYIHKIPIVHGDIRGTNILVSSDGKAYISDFGLSHTIGHMSASTAPHGSVRWKAPELHSPERFGLSAEQSQDLPCDVWSFGMTVRELLSGKVPYDELLRESMVILAILDAKLPKIPESWPPTDERLDYLWKLCQRCWAFQPSLRPPMSDVFQYMSRVESLPEGHQTRSVLETVNRTANSSSEVFSTFGVSGPCPLGDQCLLAHSRSSPSGTAPGHSGGKHVRSNSRSVSPPSKIGEIFTAKTKGKDRAKVEYVNSPPTDQSSSIHSPLVFPGSSFKPTIHDLLDDHSTNISGWSPPYTSSDFGPHVSNDQDSQLPKHNFTIPSVTRKRTAPSSYGSDDDSSSDSEDEDSEIELMPIGRPSLIVRTQATLATRPSGFGARATSPDTANSAPGEVKAKCSNCGATHTPLWRRGLNDELNCNACGLYYKLHKRPRPKSMRNPHVEGRAQVTPRQDPVDMFARCYNCHTTATPLWRKDDEGKTVCNACGLYYKLHGSARPMSMKSDVIRRRSRYDGRRIGNRVSETPSASPGVSRRASPIREDSPTLAPDSTTQSTHDYEDNNYRSSQSKLIGAHLPFASVYPSDIESIAMSPPIHKRRRMSNDSISEPPSSDGYSTPSSATSHSQRSSMEFLFSSYPSVLYNAKPVSSNSFWHPTMMHKSDNSPYLFHPPMQSPAEDSPMDYLHPPMLPQDEDSLFSTDLHPPMTVPDDSFMNGVFLHPSMFPNEQSGHDSYDTNMWLH